MLMGCRSSFMKKARWVPLCLPATKNHQSGLGASEDESDAKIFSVLESKTGQQSAPHPAGTDAKAATASLSER